MSTIKPFYFGSFGRNLFGVYHEPIEEVRPCGIVLSYPLNHEYIRSHRVFRELATRLGAIGFPVLRFDFYGCGDSDGDCEKGSIQSWIADIGTAVRELKDRSAVSQICLIGLRLGATLATMYASEKNGIDAVVLWNPVTSGERFLQEVIELDRETCTFRNGLENLKSSDQGSELLGFPITESMRKDLLNLNLLSITQRPSHDALVTVNVEPETVNPLAEQLQKLGTRTLLKHVSASPFWIQDPYKAPLPVETLRTIISWADERYS